ncbi:hypothetical protein [Echinicola rosea]|uniref:Uncharacterized protein n=1 Tax=Echinicola rosea TaxID=1807691 RepID=A0ABQ1UFY5_9BACT|nr:hypothetical protein [Echinicola rosea]GGF17920.1 hypothetical protein GCM10011339_02280 [Echinicola rosea]
MKKHLGLPLFFIILAIIALSLPQAQAQRYLILQKGGNQKTKIRYDEGDLITYQTKDMDYFISDQIKEIHRDFLVLRENILRPENIAVVDVRDNREQNRTIRSFSTIFAAAGGLLLTAETINSLYTEGELSYSKGGLIISGALLAGSFVISRFKKKYFKNEGRNKIQIIYLDIAPLEEEDDKKNLYQ